MGARLFGAGAGVLPVLALLIISAEPLQAEYPQSLQAELAAPRVVLRLSDKWFDSFVDREVVRDSPVDQVVLGVHVVGTARTLGNTKVALRTNPNHASFEVVFRGNTHSRTVGRKGPAVIHSRSETNFTATKQVVFEAGRGFYALPAKIASDTRCATDGIETTRRGWLGRVIERRAWKRIAQSKPITAQIAHDNAAERISAAFDRQIEDMLVQLNKAADLRETLALLKSSDGKARYACCSTPGYVQFMSASKARAPAPQLPPAIGNLDAPVQIWIDRAVIPANLAPAFARLQYVGSEVEGLVERLSNFLPSPLRGANRPPPPRPALNYQFIEKWTVVSWQAPEDTEPLERVALLER
ncbi:MAG: hypothetical protein WD872_14220 [Pirellulaceae bacterium]